ncbi:MAG: 30S ribosomal protein S19 [Candidatus Aenigmatarchaeota archaeon]
MPKFEWRGKTEDEIKKISLEEFMALIPARERRRLKRGFTYPEKKLLERMRKKPEKFFRTKCRSMPIIPEMIGKKIGVYNGKEYVPIEIRPDMLGHRLGEFVLTRKPVKHSAPGFGATKSSKFVPLK